MEANRKFNRIEAEDEAAQIKDLVGDKATRQDIVEAEKIVEKELEPTLGAKGVLGLFKEARESQYTSEGNLNPDFSYKALNFIKGLLSLIDPDTQENWNSYEDSSSLITGYHRELWIGNGSSGKRVFFGHTPPGMHFGEDKQDSFFMWYPKPTSYDWETSHVFWKRWMKNFKKEIVRLN